MLTYFIFLSESEVWNILHHHVIVLTLLQFLFSSVGLHRRCHNC